MIESNCQILYNQEASSQRISDCGQTAHYRHIPNTLYAINEGNTVNRCSFIKLIQQHPISPAMRSTCGIQSRDPKMHIRQVMQWQPEQELPFSLVISDSNEWEQLATIANIKYFVIPNNISCIPKHINKLKTVLQDPSLKLVIVPYNKSKIVFKTLGQDSQINESVDEEMGAYTTLCNIMNNRIQSERDQNELNAILDSHPHILKCINNRITPTFITSKVIMGGQLPQRVIYDTVRYDKLYDVINGCFTWTYYPDRHSMADKINNIIARLRSPMVYLIDINKKSSCEVEIHNLTMNNTSTRTKHIFDYNRGAIIDQCITQTQLTRQYEPCPICMNDKDENTDQVFFNCCSTHLCVSCFNMQYDTMHQYIKCHICRRQSHISSNSHTLYFKSQQTIQDQINQIAPPDSNIINMPTSYFNIQYLINHLNTNSQTTPVLVMQQSLSKTNQKPKDMRLQAIFELANINNLTLIYI